MLQMQVCNLRVVQISQWHNSWFMVLGKSGETSVKRKVSQIFFWRSTSYIIQYLYVLLKWASQWGLRKEPRQKLTIFYLAVRVWAAECQNFAGDDPVHVPIFHALVIKRGEQRARKQAEKKVRIIFTIAHNFLCFTMTTPVLFFRPKENVHLHV